MRTLDKYIPLTEGGEHVPQHLPPGEVDELQRGAGEAGRHCADLQLHHPRRGEGRQRHAALSDHVQVN